jgi:hypothetical protein
MKYTRGQAALEFLTTYGWAFLVILVMIGALAYFGVISPNKFLPERCTFQQEVTCKDYRVNGTSGSAMTVSFYITNNLGSGISEMTMHARHADNTTVPVLCSPAGTNSATNAGDSMGFTCFGDFGAVPGIGTKTKFAVNGTYKIVGGQYTRELRGEIFATRQG